MRVPARAQWIAVLALALSVRAGGAYVGQEGAERFAFGAWVMGAPRLGQPITLRVTMRGEYADTVTGLARVSLPAGAQLVSGDTLRRAHPARGDAEWEIRFLPALVGRHEIHGVLRIEDVGGPVDESEFVLPLEVKTDTVLVGGSQTIRTEHVRGRQRYRYGGEYLVPIDGPEYITQGDIMSKPRILQRQSAVDSLSRSASVVRVPFVVFIDRQGRLRDARLRGGSRNTLLERLARQALQRWTFAPAMTKAGHPVDDWLEVGVDVVPAR